MAYSKMMAAKRGVTEIRKLFIAVCPPDVLFHTQSDRQVSRIHHGPFATQLSVYYVVGDRICI
jgi:hypothetical protein